MTEHDTQRLSLMTVLIVDLEKNAIVERGSAYLVCSGLTMGKHYFHVNSVI